AFADGSLVNLNDGESSLFQVNHFVANREGDLKGGVPTRLVVAHEAPLQDRDRPRQHSLHRTGGLGLRVFSPGDGHGSRAAHVAEKNGGFHTAAAVALHPAEAGEGKSVELLTEVFDHVIAL